MTGARQTKVKGAKAACKAQPAQPCDVNYFGITVTDAKGASYPFKTTVRLIDKPLPAGAPEVAHGPLMENEFYIEVLGETSDGPEAHPATAVTEARYLGSCSKTHHGEVIVERPDSYIPRPAGSEMLPVRTNPNIAQDIYDTYEGTGVDYRFYASTCGRTPMLFERPRHTLSALVRVYRPQDWKIKLSAPPRRTKSVELERGYKSVTSLEKKSWGATTDLDSTEILNGETTTEKVHTDAQGHQQAVKTETSGVGQGRKAKKTTTESTTSFFSKSEISRVVDRKPNKSTKVTRESNKSLDSRDFKIDIQNNGRPVTDLVALANSVRDAVDKLSEALDLLKGLPKAGYWISGSAEFLALEGAIEWKRTNKGPHGERYVCLAREWSVDISGTVVKASLQIGAGVKVQAMRSLAGGAELYAYLEGSIEAAMVVRYKDGGTGEPPTAGRRTNDPMATGSITLEAKAHGKASIMGAGYGWERSASITGSTEFDPHFGDGCLNLDLYFILARAKYKAKKLAGLSREEEYEIDDLWSGNRLTEEQVKARDDDPLFRRKGSMTLKTSTPYLRLAWEN